MTEHDVFIALVFARVTAHARSAQEPGGGMGGRGGTRGYRARCRFLIFVRAPSRNLFQWNGRTEERFTKFVMKVPNIIENFYVR